MKQLSKNGRTYQTQKLAMATASPIQPIPNSIQSKLNRLRRQLTNWLVVRGLGRWLLIMLGVLAADMVLDRLFKMDFAQRLIMLVAILAIAVVMFIWRLVKPLSTRPNDDALIYEIEEQHPELNESLISSYQLARTKNLVESGTSPELANATIQRGIDQAGKLDFSKILDGSGNLINWILLLIGLGLFGLLGFGVAKNDFFGTWFNRNIMLGNAQWPQRTYLEIVGAVDGQLLLPRGSDRRQLVHITEESSDSDVSVSLEVEGGSGRNFHTMKQTGKLDGREHVFVFHNLSSEFRFRASGGDDVTEWVDIKLVEPPSIEELQLIAFLPEYTRVKELPLVGSGPHRVLKGSRLGISVKSTKKLKECQVKSGETVYQMRSVSDDRLHFQLMIPKADGESVGGGDYSIELIDESGLASNRPAKFSVVIDEDKPPKVRADLLGISGMVVSRARIPVEYNALDEYGLTKLQFDCSWKSSVDGVADSAPAMKRAVDFPRIQTDDGPVREVRDVNLLELEPLNLQPGDSFRMAVKAFDNCPNPVGTGNSQEFLLRVVTEEELRASLLQREVEQRKAFEQAYNSQLELASELQAIVASRKGDKTLDAFNADREQRLIGVHRNQKLVGTSVDRIANRFEEFLVEVKNNRLDEEENEQAPEQTIERRFDQKIIRPIRDLDANLLSVAVRHLDNCRRVVRDADQLQVAANDAAIVQQEVLQVMKQILDSMVDSENFQEAVNKLLEIKRLEERLKGEINKRDKSDDIFDPEESDDIFDDN